MTGKKMMRNRTTSLLLLVLTLCPCLMLISCERNAPSAAHPEQLQKVSLATPKSSLLGYTIYVGQAKGFFREEGVDLSVLDSYPHGQATMAALSSGETDLAVAAETPFMFAVLNGARISAFARTLSAVNHFAVVARKDRGIAKAADLEGKRVGLVFGTAGEYFWDLFVAENHLSRPAIEMVHINPPLMADALQRGEVDAIASWNPFSSQAQEALADQGVSFYSDMARVMFLIAARQNTINNNPEIIIDILRGLEKSSQFIRTHRDEADRIVAQAIGVEEPLLKRLSSYYRFDILLDQSLIKALEDAARWAIDKRLTAGSAVPNFLENVYAVAMDRVKPEASIIFTPSPQTIRIAEGHQPIVAPVLVAQAKGYFENLGLHVELRPYHSGKACLDAVTEGEADLATAGDIPIMYAIMEDHNIRIVATIEDTKKNNAIVARADSGIRIPQDLKGKKIGVTPGTGAEFFLDSFLLFHGMSRGQTEFVSTAPAEMVDAILSRRVDAVSTWNPQVSDIVDKLAGNGRVFYGEEFYTATQNIVGQHSFIARHPEVVTSIILALDRAIIFIKENPGEAQKIVAEALNMDRRQLARLWGMYNFQLRLDQTLLMTLRDEARWATRNNLVEKTVIPAFSNFIYSNAMREIKPLSVTIMN